MRQIYLFSVIDSWVSESVVKRLLELDRESNEEITMLINSPGGYVTQMMAIIDTMNIIKSPVRTVVVGIAASAAAVIASSGKTRLIAPTAQIMIHEVSAGTFGSVSEMRESLENIAAQNEILASILAKNTKKHVDEIKEMWKKTDKYFSAQDAVLFGLTDRIIHDNEAPIYKLSEGINVEGFEIQSGAKEIQLLREGRYSHPVYGQIVLSEQSLESMKKNFEANVRGQDISIDYTHDNESGESPAAFWIKSLEIKSNEDGKGKGLFARGEFTPMGAKKVSEKEYKYSSADFVIDYVAQDGKHFPYVLRGGTLTNRPFIKNMNPIKLAETKEIIMDKEALIAGLKAHGVDVSALNAQVESMTAKVRDLEGQIAELNKLPAAKEEEIKTLKDKLSEANDKIVLEAKDKAFDALVAEGKVTPAQKASIMATFKSAEEISAFFKDAPKVVATAPAGSSKGNESEALTEDEQKLVNAGTYTAEQIIAGRSRVKKDK